MTIEKTLKLLEKCLGKLYIQNQTNNIFPEEDIMSENEHELDELANYLMVSEAIIIKLGENVLNFLDGVEKLAAITIVAEDLNHLRSYSILSSEKDEISFSGCGELREALTTKLGNTHDQQLLVLLLMKHANFMLLKLLAENISIGDAVLSRHVKDEEKHTAILAKIFASTYNKGNNSEYLDYVHAWRGVIGFIAAVNDEIINLLAPIIGGGFEENHVDLGRQRITFMHEDMHTSRVNLLRKIGFDLITAQKISEEVGGLVKAGFGC